MTVKNETILKIIKILLDSGCYNFNLRINCVIFPKEFYSIVSEQVELQQLGIPINGNLDSKILIKRN